jgi:hypothetical protein
MNSDQPWATLKHALVQRSCKGNSCEKGTDSDSSSLMKFSATCFYFAQELSDALGAEAPPIGLVHTAWGGSTIEQWLTNETIATCEYVKPAASHQEFHDTRVLPYTGMSLKGFVWCEWHSCAFPPLLCACACVAPADCLTLPRLLQIKGRTTATRSWGTAPPRPATPARCRFVLALAITRTTGLIHAYVCCRLSWTIGARFGVPRQAPPTHQHPLASTAWRAPAPKVHSPPGNQSVHPWESLCEPFSVSKVQAAWRWGQCDRPRCVLFYLLSN